MNKKIVGLALSGSILLSFAPVLAQNPPPAPPTRRAVGIACAQAAVDARELALGDVWTKLSSAVTVALAARKAALYDAWGKPDYSSRNSARQAAWNAWRLAHQAATNAFITGRQAAQNTFIAAMQKCGTPIPPVEAPGVGKPPTL